MTDQPPQLPTTQGSFAPPSIVQPSSARPSTIRPPTGPLPAVVLARDIPRPTLEAAVRAGELERIRPGAYRRLAPGAEGRTESVGRSASSDRSAQGGRTKLSPAEARELALARMAAINGKLRTPFWFSHESAALIWGCPLWTPPTATHLIQTVRPSTHSEPLLTRHFASLPPSDRHERRGVPVTSLDRTVVDCLVSLPPLDALVIADGALRFGADREAIAARLGARGGARGVVGARVVLDHADGRAESAWETALRYIVVGRGLPRPQLQIPIHTRLGWFRADLGWEEWKLLLEFDGFTKYSTFAGADPARVLFNEKRRQEAIEEEGWGVIRVTAKDANRPDDVIRRVCRRAPVGIRLTPIRAFTSL